MEVVEEVMGSNDHVHIVKGKRTKRQRPSSPLAAFDMATSSGEGEGGGGGGGGGRNDHQDGVGYGNRDEDGQNNHSSPTTTSFTTEEEEDMANCLIMLAQGHSLDNSKQMIEDDGGAIMEKFISRRFTEAPTTTNNKAGYYVYQCKTCSRCFPSFQALGGHRASHKKPKAMVGEKRTLMLLDDDTPPSLTLHMGNRASYTTTHTTNNNNNNNKSKVHECSICGSEFSSGQALGGHMRRHRSSTTANMGNTIAMDTIRTTESQEPRNGLSLDLNLPAPEEDRESKFMFSSKQQPPLVFSASSLVDCHY